jgi:glycosyltransferase involved in cell wall biosynthesis
VISLITPAFNEGANLPVLHERLTSVFRQLDWEWIIVDDHSRDNTFEVIERLVALDPRVRGIRLAYNSGSHLAFTCGLRHASGEVAALMVADLQDPPELLIQMLERWRSGVQVVWAVRRHQPGDGSGTQLYYWIMRNLVGMNDMPATGADFFLVDRVVIDAFLAAADRHVSIFALMMWLGFRREFIQYDKQPRTRGRSGWTLTKKLKLVVDSIVGFSDFPIWWLTYAGAAALVVALVPAVVAVVAYSGLNAALLLLAALVIGLFGCHLIALGILGHYVWRGLDAARKRPLYSIEAVAKAHDVPAAVAGDRRQ